MNDRYVSRAGPKLEFALEHFSIDVEGLTCADFGSSKGGFVDCLLQKGADKVYAVDTSYGELDYKLRTNPKVVVMERTNALYIELSELCDFISIDCGWTKLEKIIPSALRNIKPGGKIVALLKPSFEAGSEVKLNLIGYEKAVEYALKPLRGNKELTVAGLVDSPVVGEKGKNKEFLVFILKA